jgi:hypothetical protein
MVLLRAAIVVAAQRGVLLNSKLLHGGDLGQMDRDSGIYPESSLARQFSFEIAMADLQSLI